jgi:transposase InsO family protein
MTDNGPQFTAEEFRKFAQKYDLEHVASSPHYPRSNGKVEAAVKSAKRIMKKTRESGADQYLALLDIRNTPTTDLPRCWSPLYAQTQSHLRKTNESDPLNDAYSSTTNAKVKRYVLTNQQ